LNFFLINQFRVKEVFDIVWKIQMEKRINKMEKENLEKELSQLMELTLRLEDELNCMDY
jgi:hypothetical protein